ncbi:MAG: extracellular solute-binding protein [Chloroflexi bacterium]|nr:extracellular solute-binding protein [Chloroflexota bacterium]
MLKRKGFGLLLVALVLVALVVAPAAAQSDTFVYWGGLIFSETANQMLVDRITAWGAERGVPVEVVMINQNETVQRVSAAIEAGNMPDAFDVGLDLMLLLALQEQIVPVAETYAAIGEAHGGWTDSVDGLVTTVPGLDGEIYGVPFAVNGNVLFRRNDVLEPAGYPDAPETWAELSEMAKAQTPPDNYGMAFALSNVGDGNLMTTILQSYGGRIADDEGKTCMIDSPETRAFMEWVTGAYAEGLFPPGATTWDGAGDNTAYQTGQALFIANPGSVYLYMRDNDPELGEGTRYSALPAGPAMRLSPFQGQFRVISANSDKAELAADLFVYLADDDFMAEYFNNAIYAPVLESQVGFSIFTESPVHAGLLDLGLNGTPQGFPDINNPAFAEYQTNFLTPKMVVRVVVDGLSIDEAIAETQAACQAIYDKYE